MRASEVFTPNGRPEITFVNDHLYEKARLLRQYLETGGAVISLSGPSKSGKTVFIEKNIGKDNLLQVTGAGVDSPQKLWDRVFDLIGTPTKTSNTEGSGFKGSASAKASGGVPLVAQGELSTIGEWATTVSTAIERSPDYLQLLIKELGGTDFVIFIDDFHYIPREIQLEVSNQIKEAIRGGVKFICASVPYHSDDVLRANPDLRGRIFKLDFAYWSTEELCKIANRGFDALNIELSDAMIKGFASEAAGSPQLMQSLCLSICFHKNLDEKQNSKFVISTGIELIADVCKRTAATTDYSSTVEKMKDGPKARGVERISHLLKDSTIRDVYPIILKAVAADPPTLTIRYKDLQTRIGNICQEGVPSGSSVTGACAHLSDIANAADNRVIVEWDNESDILDIRDPYLLFFLRWGQWI